MYRGPSMKNAVVKAVGKFGVVIILKVILYYSFHILFVSEVYAQILFPCCPIVRIRYIFDPFKV
jgi:hypothetical protein